MKNLILILLMWLASSLAFAKNSGDYLLGAGDVVKISVYDHPDLATEIQLTNDGDLTFPLIGKVMLSGLSFADAEQLIAKKLRDGGFINNPSVNVLVTQYRSQRISVLGEVNRPGRYALDSASDIFDVLAIAGGIAPTGGDKIIIMHGGKNNEVQLSQIVSGKNRPNIAIRIENGDIIFVPRMQQIYVYGEVNRPGNFRLDENMNVMQALSVAGGFTPKASKSSIVVSRTDDGKTKELEVGLTDHLQDGDVVYVKESLF